MARRHSRAAGAAKTGPGRCFSPFGLRPFSEKHRPNPTGCYAALQFRRETIALTGVALRSGNGVLKICSFLPVFEAISGAWDMSDFLKRGGFPPLFRYDECRPFSRFTPARAGNTSRRSTGSPPPAVHPCAGREHFSDEQTSVGHYGSPLRGQGTLRVGDFKRVNRRFTPARAGNTHDQADPRHTRSVHPCAGREHLAILGERPSVDGSPLRGQGTPSLAASDGRI